MYRFYSRPTGTNIRVSVVGEHSDGVLKIAVARCSKKDHFVKKKGRTIAEGRLKKGKYYQKIQMRKCNISTFVSLAKAIAKHVSKNPRAIYN